MSDHQPTNAPVRRKLTAGRTLAALCLLLACYVLSMGPASALRTFGGLSVGTYRAIYAPIFWACGHSDFLDVWMDKWCALWQRWMEPVLLAIYGMLLDP